MRRSSNSIVRLVLGLGLILAPLGGSAVAAPDARELLRLSRVAQTKLTFEGLQVTTIRTPGQRTRTARQKVWRWGLRLRIEYDRGMILVDDGKTFTRYTPRTNVAEQGESRARRFRQSRRPGRGRPPGRDMGPKVEFLGKGTVAGRAVYKVRLAAPSGRERTLWIDQKNHLMLRMDEKARGRATSTYFESIKFVDSIPAKRFQLKLPPGVVKISPGLRRIPPERAQAMARAWGGLRRLDQKSLPPGYRFRGHFMRSGRRQQTLVSVYSTPEGETLTLFQGAGKSPRRREQVGRLRVGEAQRGSAKITVVGPLDRDTMNRVLKSIR